MRKSDSLIPFLAGLGTGVAAAVFLTPGPGRQNRNRIRDIANRAGNALKKRAADDFDDAADTAKTMAGQIVDKSKDLAHNAGETLEAGGRQLQDT